MSNFIFYFFLLLTLSLTSPTIADASDKNLNFLLNSIDPNKKTFTINQVENSWQEAMNNLVVKGIEIHDRTKGRVKSLGSIMYKSNSELSNTQNISNYIEKIKHYRSIKKEHYDSFDQLMLATNTAIGKKELTKKRLGGGNQYYEERLELFYLYDLDNYYKFIISNHGNFGFKDEKISLKGSDKRKQYKILLNKVIESKANINKIFNLKNNLLKDRMNELKDWNKIN
jgi:hypothetical protein